MLEQQIEKLTERVGFVEQGQARTNELLAQILAAIREGGLPPAPSVTVAVDNTVNDEPIEEAPVEQADDASEDAAPATIEDVRDALMNYRDAHGKDATVDLMARFIPEGSKPIVSEIPKDKYADVIVACAADDRAAA